MTPFSSTALLAALGVLGAIALPAAAATPDTSEWACESCPFPKGTSGHVDAGVGAVSEDSRKFGDMTGLGKQGAHLVLGGALSHRSEGGTFADLRARDLGLDTRELGASLGREGLFTLRLGYSALPRSFADGARTPFLGNGSDVLTLPAGFAADSTAAMPLATKLQGIDLGYDWQRVALGGSVVAGRQVSLGLRVTRDVRDGTRPTAASFFSTAAQMAAPVKHVTDGLEVSAVYGGAALQASLAYQISEFRNDAESLTWDNPFLPVVTGATRGRLALAPANRFHQLSGSAGYTITPALRASADFAIGQGRQDETYLDPTLNTNPAAGLPGRSALPAASLDGKVDTFSGSVKLSATPLAGLRLAAEYARDVRDNDTAIRAYPQVSTDMFLALATRSNTPFGHTRDRIKLAADWRGPGTLRVAGGAEQDERTRSYTEAVKTRETTLWARVDVPPMDELALGVKLAHAERDHSTYGIATWFGAPENPLLRKYNLAERRRDSVGVRADLGVGENVAIGLSVDYANDDYHRSIVGLQSARSLNLGADLSWTIGEATRLTLFAQGERIESRQAGSQVGGNPDWTGRGKDRFEIVGVGVKHAVIADKLDIGADVTLSRARSDLRVETRVVDPSFPTDKTEVDSVKLYASYKFSDKLTMFGSLWHEEHRSTDWRLDGILPATVDSLLVFGAQAPRYKVDVLRLGVRYRF